MAGQARYAIGVRTVTIVSLFGFSMSLTTERYAEYQCGLRTD